LLRPLRPVADHQRGRHVRARPAARAAARPPELGAVEILMTLAPVRRGEEEDLRRILSEIACRPDCNPYVDFGKSPSTHFVRFVVTTDEDHGPRLLFVANYDGGLRSYISELERAGPGLGQVFGRTEGFHDRDLMAYARRHCCNPRGVYIAFPGLTVAGV